MSSPSTTSRQTTPTAPIPPVGHDASVTAAVSRQQSSGTVGFLRRSMIVVLAMIAATTLLGVVAGFVLQDTARTTDGSTAPSLVGIQDLFASVAEANAAATSAHLSVEVAGVEDRASRNLYLDAIRRANEQLTVVAADLGRSDLDTERSDDGLQEIAGSLNSYSRAVEAARVENLNDLPEADTRLREALDLVDTDIGPLVTDITTDARIRYDADAERGTLLAAVAIVGVLATLATMVIIQYRLAQRVRRVLNPFLVGGTLALIGFLAVFANGFIVREQALSDASDGGYDAVVASARMQEATFGLQSQLGLLLLEPAGREERSAVIGELIAEAEGQVVSISEAADSTRETAAAEALAVRWIRYREVAMEVTAQAGTSTSGSVETFQGEALSAFNGVNTAIESVLSDNRTQFTDGVIRARTAVERLPWICLALAVLAAVATLLGFQSGWGTTGDRPSPGGRSHARPSPVSGRHGCGRNRCRRFECLHRCCRPP